MYTIKQPSKIIFGKHASEKFQFPNDCLIVTSSGAKKRGWLDKLSIKNYYIFDKVEPNPSIETVKKIISEYDNACPIVDVQLPKPNPVTNQPSIIFSLLLIIIPSSKKLKASLHRNFVYMLPFLLSNPSEH